VSEPQGGPYEWYQRALTLLQSGDSAPAAVLLERVLVEDPSNRGAMEAHARALFDAARYREAEAAFRAILERAPDDDYARFGLGSSLWRLQRFREARDELGMAVVMRPGNAAYAQALAQVKATLRAREEANLPLDGPLP
jgi:Flp pilus assembly protein TadD